MKPRIAIPQPHSQKLDYNQRSFPQYARAIERAGGEPVEVALDLPSNEIARLLSTCQGVLLPGSPADVDPQKYSAPRHPKTAPADPARDNADELLLQDAFNLRKPLLGICYGLQSLNVWRSGTLVQDIESDVPHGAGSKQKVAHEVEITPHSRLALILESAGLKASRLLVNSSHHQAAETPGDGLLAVARCPDDGVIEALEGTQPGHFVLALQWHPERGAEDDSASQSVFKHFVDAAREYREK